MHADEHRSEKQMATLICVNRCASVVPTAFQTFDADSLGSNRSRKPSPRKFRLSSVTASKVHGNRSSHQPGLTGLSAGCNASAASEPHVLSGGAMPMPRKLRSDSSNIARGTVKVAYTMIGP